MLLFLLACTASSGQRCDDTATPGSDTGTPADSGGGVDANPCLDLPPLAEQPDTPFLAEFAPAVVCTWPRAGDMAADPSITEITVRFSHDMLEGSHAWVSKGDSRFPETTGNPVWLDARTQQLPVAMIGQSTYGIWINSDNVQSFVSTDGVPAAPYPLYFRTAAE